ncbi:MAG: 3'-5' exonuclease, partial [Blastococcus sp.]
MNAGTHAGHGADVEVALTALWGALRLAVLDIETCNGADGDHVIDLAVLTYRHRRLVGTWARRFQPGVPVDAASQAVHGLSDADLARERPFGEAVAELTAILTPADGERLVVVAHNASFDVSRLQLEFSRAGTQLPDVAVLDTAALARHVGLRVGSRADLLDALGLTNTAPHTAHGDADATARAAVALLRRAAAAGAHDLDQLLATAMAGRKARTGTIKAAGKTRRREREPEDEPSFDLPDQHTAGHAQLLPDRPSRDDLTAWLTEVAECARLRCPYLDDRVATAGLPPDELLVLLEPSLAGALADADPARAATVLGALRPLLGALPNRSAALRWYTKWRPKLDATGSCPDDDRCPA